MDFLTDMSPSSDRSYNQLCGEPVQIIRPSPNILKTVTDYIVSNLVKPKYDINEEAFYNILRVVGKRKLAIISVNGPQGTGKSFLLNFILRYLRYIDQEDENWIKKDEQLDGFKWKSGPNPTTIGIWMWTKPFIIKRDTEEIAVLLMDTQGNFDSKMTMTDNAVIFAMSTLMSSVLIFNNMNDIREDIYQFLDFFSDFARTIGEEQGNVKPFQSLIMLVRDWFKHKSFAYGFHDDDSPSNNNYKKQKFDPLNIQNFQVQSVHEAIDACFENIAIFLTPFPGEKTAGEDNTKGILSLMNNEFVTYIKTFVETILKERLILKKVGGEEVTGETFGEYARKWFNFVKKGKLPMARTVKDSNAIVKMWSAYRRAEDLFRTSMDHCIKSDKVYSEDTFEPMYKKMVNESIVFFKENHGLKSKEIEEDFVKNLTQTFKSNFSLYNIIIENKKTIRDKEEAYQKEKDELEKKMHEAEQLLRVKQEEEINAKGWSDELQENHKKEIEQLKEKNELKKMELGTAHKTERETLIKTINELNKKIEEIKMESSKTAWNRICEYFEKLWEQITHAKDYVKDKLT